LPSTTPGRRCRRSADGRRHDLSRNLIRVWIEKAEAGSLDQDMASAELLSGYAARIAALERLVGRQALEIEFLKGGQKNGRSPKSGHTSATSGLPASPSNGGAR
jgi:transposase